MKRKTPAIIGALLAAAFSAAGIFTACDLEVAAKKPLKPIIAPYISVPPAGASYAAGDTVDPLQAQIWDWKPESGQLSYQWYAFENVADFVSTGGTPKDSGALDPETDAVDSDGVAVMAVSYDPTGITQQAGKRYYYYIEVTNTDPEASDETEKTVRSEIAAVTFNAPGQAAIPLITRHPSGATYRFGRNMTIAALTVRALSPDSGDLTYKWYYDTTRTGNPGAANANLQLINNTSADPTIYTPTTDLLIPGRNFFFVIVTNTTGDGSTDELSVPAVLEMEAGERPLEPEITEQPEDRVYFRNQSPPEVFAPMRVTARPAMDGGTITYQWFTNTKPEARGGTRIAGAASPTYTHSSWATGVYYYYAEVTNTNPNVKSTVKTATAASRAVKITVADPSSIPAANAVNVTVTVRDPRDPAQRFQYIRGYGGMDTAWANFPEQKPADMETMYNPDWGLGLNINRIMISPGNTNVNTSIRDLINSHRPYYYENVRIVNKYGGYNLASPWSPPKEWKSNNSINGGGNLIHMYRQQYANYLRAFAKNMYDAGAPIYAISISNEPNYVAGYDGCEWSPDEMRDFYKEVTPQPFTKGIRGYGGGREMERVLTVNGESANTPYINVSALRDPAARANIDLLGRHVYGEQQKTLWRVLSIGGANDNPDVMGPGVAGNIAAVISNNPPSILYKNDSIPGTQSGTMYEVWMTEHNINSANATAYPNDSTWNYVWRFMNDVDLVMRMNNENAFIWWASKRFYSLVGDGQFGTRDGAVLPRGVGLSHYAKYSIDTHRVNVQVQGRFTDGREITSSLVNHSSFNMDNTAVRVTAYASIESGKDNKPVKEFVYTGPAAQQTGWDEIDFISLVMWAPTNTSGRNGNNMGTVRVVMPDGFEIGGVSAHKSASASKLFLPENVTVHPDRKSAYVTLNAGQLLSVKLTRKR